MIRNVVTIDDSYFNMKRFEEKLAYAPFCAEKRIIKRKKSRLLDRILTIFVMIALIAVIILGGLTAYHFISIKVKDMQISSLTKDLNKKDNELEKAKVMLNVDTEYDSLKKIAFLELNMITPTDKNIIYFEKSDTQ